MSDPKTTVIGHVTPLPGASCVYPRGNKCEAGDRCQFPSRCGSVKAKVDARLATPLPPNVITYPLSVLDGMDRDVKPENVKCRGCGEVRATSCGAADCPVPLQIAGALSTPRYAIPSVTPAAGPSRSRDMTVAAEDRWLAALAERDALAAEVERQRALADGWKEAAEKWESVAKTRGVRLDALGEAIEANLPEVPRLTEGSAPAGVLEQVAYAGELLRSRIGEVERDAASAKLVESELHASKLIEERDTARNALEIARHSLDKMRDACAEWKEAHDRKEENERTIKLRTSAIESDLGIKIVDHAEPSDQRLLRVRMRILRDISSARAKAATLKRWQARARKAEARVAALTEERDGLTLRLGEQERTRVRRGVKAKPGSVVRGSRWRHRKTGRIAVIKPSDRGRGWVAYRYESGHRYARDLTLTCTVTRGRFLTAFEPIDASPARTRKGGRS